MSHYIRPADGEPPKFRARKGPMSTLVALIALLGTIAVLYLLFPHAWNFLQTLSAENALGEFLLRPATIGVLILLAGELALGLLLAQETFSAEDQNYANCFIFIVLLLSAVITEAAAFLAATVTVVLAILILLGSLLLIIGTAVWLWTNQFLRFRRRVCSILVPYYFAYPIWAANWVLSCLLFGVKNHIECVDWIARQFSVCVQWAQQCQNWISRQRATCTSWLPSFLGWICYVVEIVVYVVCGAWVVVCVLFAIIAYLVCAAFLIVVIVVCLVLGLLLLITVIGWLVDVGILRIVFFC